MKQRLEHYGIAILTVLAIFIAGGLAFVYSGVYDIGADAPHTRPVYVLMQTLRERSIDARAGDIRVPDLQDPQLILEGAGQYAAMCTDCHLRPGMRDSEIRPGLYPRPPDLSQVRVDPEKAFWVIKHGIKMSAMPAWGSSHGDPTIWSMVAFLQKLPGMTPAQYEDMVARAPPDEDMDGGDHEAGHRHHDHAGEPARGETGQGGSGGADTGHHAGDAAAETPVRH